MGSEMVLDSGARSVTRAGVVLPQTMGELWRFAQAAAASNLFAVKSPEAAFMILQTGMELGLLPAQAMRGIDIIEGKPRLSADLMVALVVSRRDVCEYFQLIESSIELATYETKRVGAPKPVTLSYTQEQAQRAGRWGRNTWSKDPEDMLRHRSASKLVRSVYPDLIFGVYTPDEIEDIVESRTLRRGAPAGVPQPPASEPETKALSPQEPTRAELAAPTVPPRAEIEAPAQQVTTSPVREAEKALAGSDPAGNNGEPRFPTASAPREREPGEDDAELEALRVALASKGEAGKLTWAGVAEEFLRTKAIVGAETAAQANWIAIEAAKRHVDTVASQGELNRWISAVEHAAYYAKAQSAGEVEAIREAAKETLKNRYGDKGLAWLGSDTPSAKHLRDAQRAAEEKHGAKPDPTPTPPPTKSPRRRRDATHGEHTAATAGATPANTDGAAPRASARFTDGEQEQLNAWNNHVVRDIQNVFKLENSWRKHRHEFEDGPVRAEAFSIAVRRHIAMRRPIGQHVTDAWLHKAEAFARESLAAETQELFIVAAPVRKVA